MYTADAALVTTLSVRWYAPGATWDGRPPRTSAGGYGDYVWAQTQQAIRVYRISEGREIQFFTPGRFGFVTPQNVVASGGSVAFFQSGHLVRLALDGDSPSIEERDFPSSNLTDFVTDAEGRWTIVSKGVLYTSIHAAHSAGPLPIGCGVREALTASPSGVVAISTADGRVRIFDLSAQNPRLILTLLGSRVSVSRDGTRMLVEVFEQPADARSTLHLIELPQGKILYSFSRADWESLQRTFALSPNGDAIARVLFDSHGHSTTNITRDDGTLLYPPIPMTDSLLNKVAFSSDGKSVALTHWLSLTDRPSLLIEDGSVQRTVPGLFNGWLDDSRFVVSKKEGFRTKTQLLTRSGDATIDLPFVTALGELSVIDSEHVLSLAPFRILHIPDGAAVWTGNGLPFAAIVAGDYVVFDQDSSIVTDRWR